MPKKENVVSEIIEKAVPAPDNSAQDYSDVPVYYEPFSYAQENDEVDMEFCKDMAQHRKRLNEEFFMIEKGEEPRSSAVKMKIRAKK